MLTVIVLTAFGVSAAYVVLCIAHFPGASSIEFKSEEQYGAALRKKRWESRELHILYAVVMGISTGLINCRWTGRDALPLLITLVGFEACWLLLTNWLWRPTCHRYFEIPQLRTACLIAAALGVSSLVFFSTGTIPLAIGCVFSVASFVALSPSDELERAMS